jgi:hypothetical protein
MKLAAHLINIASAELGVQESPRGSNRGPRVDDYQRATWLKPADWGPWCAAFVCFVVMRAMMAGKEAGARYTFNRPLTAGAFDLERWSLSQDDSTKTLKRPGSDILPGDILIYTFSHVGIALTAPDKSGRVIAIEGNSNDDGSREGFEVVNHSRRLSQIRTRIRFTV